ncbi:MAG: AbrB/MazE/SpoVT family DNA-binding domain-containing protein [Austwickia sp.]|jgi:antitoxin PrlF|nr:MAG: AbrB/MazE/SpoVT family DNA-binding domain-containing protein [Austwickia sp.]
MLVGEKGQVTIPKQVRDELGIGPGSTVSFEVHDGGAMLRKVGSTRGRTVVAAMRGRGDVAMSTDEIMALTRDA